MNNLIYKYLVIEDDTNVWANIERRMNVFNHWTCVGFTPEIEDALEKITNSKPQLIFLDWSIKGGNAFQILDFIHNIKHYHPYIIFFTGFQNEHPEIPQEIINNRNLVKKYLIKPIYENLTKYLSIYIEEAENLWLNDLEKRFYFIENEFKQKIKIYPHECIAILQSKENPRLKIIHMFNKEPISIRYTWDEIIDFLESFSIDFFISNNRKSILNRNYITKISRPFIWMNNELKIEVARERWQFLKPI